MYAGQKHPEDNSFLMMILFVYVTVLSVSLTDERLQFSQMG